MITPAALLESLLRARERLAGESPPRDQEELPLRAELFGADQMEQHGKALAASHKIAEEKLPDRLLARLAQNEGVLVSTCSLLTETVKESRRVTPAGEWLLDNFYLIEEQIRTAFHHLPKTYSRELPRLAKGPSAKLPRVYDIALETIAHGDGRFDIEGLSRFVSAYQTVEPLKLGELWAIPIMLRLALVENLRRVAARVANGTIDRGLAEVWADQMMQVAERDPTNLILVVADMARSNPPLSSAFVAEMARRLHGQTPAVALSLTWIEHRLSEQNLSIEQMVQAETREQAADQVTIGNSIGSLRLLGWLDWREFVETMSVVDQKLREDPADVYGRMDFGTRDRYRHVVERVAKASRLSEVEVARKAVQLCADRRANRDDPRMRHVGYYLIDRGLPQLERAVNAKLSPLRQGRRVAKRHALLLYAGAIIALTAALTALLIARGSIDGLDGWRLALLGLVAVVATSQLAVALVNWVVTLLAKPHALPRMDFVHGIPSDFRTLVVVPSMLTGVDEIDHLVEALEVRFLANRDANVHFGLLTDFPDAPGETMPGDAELVAHARERIRALNAKYAADDGNDSDRFYLLHRPRRWNESERVWMGYERKRGKLEELNALLRGGPADPFMEIVGDVAHLSNVKYVITLDTDTELPRDAARQLAGTMAHPLNQPRYDERARRVVAGCAILQPRIAINLIGANRSLYARLTASEPGIDPYTRVVSDVYQDLFGEGSFIGKGIYDIDAFRRALDGKLPENRILSHDLIEGCFARSSLVTDVQLYEDTPSRYSADISRRHRWVRGDFQIAQWALPRLLVRTSGTYRNPLSGLSRLKILDNLRRGVAPAALLALLLIGWTMTPAPWVWTLAALAIVFVPPLVVTLLDVARKPRAAGVGQHLAATLRAGGMRLSHAALSLACLPYEAYVNLDAILRTLFRMLVSRRRLLEWNPSRDAEREAERRERSDMLASYRTMWIGPALALAFLAAPRFIGLPETAVVDALPVLLLWIVAPGVTWLLGRPIEYRESELSPQQVAFLHRVARKTWRFFETFVGPEDHWLPPDNYQEHPVAVVAHRTSPTNIGVSLLANLAAYDFGYITGGELVERCHNTLETMQSMARYDGHLYNWYDTLTLKPLHPLYVSSVDSGNLAGHLLTLRPGLAALPDQPLIGLQWFEGLLTTLHVMMDSPGAPDPVKVAPLRRDLESAYDSRATSLDEVWKWLATLTRAVESLQAEPAAAAVANAEPSPLAWPAALLKQCRAAREELQQLAPWLALPAPPNRDLRAPGIAAMPTLADLATMETTTLPAIRERAAAARNDEREWLQALERAVAEGSRNARERLARIAVLIDLTTELATMDLSFLYDHGRHLLAIGYNVSDRRLDTSFYDLLASEARLASFVGIAQGQLPQDNWFALGRLLTRAGTGPVLLSWSGSMFEYLMPLLVMPSVPNTLLDQTHRAVVARQIAYGNKRNVPWGISESGYNTVDAAMNYQYRAFGVPGLGLKRGLAEDLVVAPYATNLALTVAPAEACRNLQRLTAMGFEGVYGHYEAIDFTPARVPRGQTFAIVRSFMAHHQGMSLLALAYRLLDRPMQKRFESDPEFKATMLLLHERVPQAAAYFHPPAMLSEVQETVAGPPMPVRMMRTADTPIPEVQLLSNGRYHVMVTNAGGGYSRWRDLAVTRWREDGTCDGWGTFCFIRDVASGEFWSYARQPVEKAPVSYEAIFAEARVDFRRRDVVEGGEFETHAEIVVSPEDDIELRRLKVTNRSRTRKTIDITSYAEVVLATPAADSAHPAFSKLFVQTEIDPRRHAIIATRRPRSKGEQPPFVMHQMVVHGVETSEVSYQTDRARFIGRGRTIAAPLAMEQTGALSNDEGSVLDPIVAIRYRLRLDPDQTATVDVVTGVGETRDAAVTLAGKYQDRYLADRVFDLAWTHSLVALRHINASESEAQLYARLASSVIYANPALRAPAGVLIRNRRGQSGLWSYAISGDLPIVLLQVGDTENMDLVRQLVRAHAYWRSKGLAVDLVVWNEDRAGYRQQLQDQIMGLIAAGAEAHLMDRPGGIFVRRAEQIADEDRVLLQSVARAIISDRRGTLAEQVSRRGTSEARALQLNMLKLKPARIPRAGDESKPARAARVGETELQKARVPAPQVQPRELQFFNGTGGFAEDGREYVIQLRPGDTTPMPWSNVLANERLGTVISESGQAYSWTENAHELRLTPWFNDPVTDLSGEAFYVRDEESGSYWSPAPLPARGTGDYTTRHGFGYSVFEHVEDGIATELTVYVDVDEPVKYSVLRIRNDSARDRRLSATGYVEWTLGDQRGSAQMHVVTEIDAGSGALSAHNFYDTQFGRRIAFLDVDELTRTQGVTVTGDRTEFIGRNNSLRNPAAMGRAQLSNRVGPAHDPCGAIHVTFDLGAGQERELVFRLGAGRDAEEAGKLMHRFRGQSAAKRALENVRLNWRRMLEAVRVETPDPMLNILANGWLIYQTLACRYFARSGYYQSGGAYGFRDQLQDVMALIHSEPLIARRHLLVSASRQFKEGDVQHWWHPPVGRGVRTRCSDDYLWLPLATARYVEATGDTGVLQEQLAYLEGRPVPPDEESYFDLPGRSDVRATLYEHCVAAINNGLRFGAHGLPLIGSGDWNDGMNLVGIHGKGESVWLGFFLYDVLSRFARIAKLLGDQQMVERCQVEAVNLRRNLELHAWDGNWYRRAYFDDGMPLGSATNDECQIDSISQSWSVLSGAGEPRRARAAMAAVDQRLVRRAERLIQLLTPPFDRSTMDPGYIRGYVPGVRENGGQYTHAAIWTVMAFAALGDAQRAWELARMINPIDHARTADDVATYKAEPYVIAADVYAVDPHTGRGGWTWYTGSAGWMYRLLVESLLGLELEVDKLRFTPILPDDWTGFTIDYRYRETVHRITIVQVDASEQRTRVTQDGVVRGDDMVQLVDDRKPHVAEVRIPRRPGTAAKEPEPQVRELA